jgi:hypothetical protein
MKIKELKEKEVTLTFDLLDPLGPLVPVEVDHVSVLASLACQPPERSCIPSMRVGAGLV